MTGIRGGSSTPGGSTTQLQYNNAGVLAGLSTLTTDGTNLTLASASFGLSGNITGAGIFGTSGIRYKNSAGTLSDTTSSGTIATNYNNLWGGNTQIATSATTITDNYGSYFVAPTISTNVTATNNYALGADSFRVTSSGAASFSPLRVTGTWYVAGSATTNYPAVFITATGASIANLNTNGSGLVINAPSGFSASGSIAEFFTNGVSKHFFGGNGDMVIQGNFTQQGAVSTFGGNTSQTNSTSGFAAANNKGYSWSSTTGSNGTLDTGFWRISAGVIGAGNGTASDHSAQVYAGTLRTSQTTVAGLPSASTSGAGATAFVTDANATFILGLGLTAVGGGSNKVPVYSDGTNWIVG